MAEFREVMSQCYVYDLGFSGALWTFDNKQKGDRNIKVRPDRVVASMSWSTWFQDVRLHQLVSSRSNHAPTLLEIDRDESERSPRHIAHYEIMWERELSLPEEVRTAWAAGVPVQGLGDIAGNLKRVMHSLTRWSKEKFGAITQELDKLRERLEEVDYVCH
jgi:hypothetical protein